MVILEPTTREQQLLMTPPKPQGGPPLPQKAQCPTLITSAHARPVIVAASCHDVLAQTTFMYRPPR